MCFTILNRSYRWCKQLFQTLLAFFFVYYFFTLLLTCGTRNLIDLSNYSKIFRFNPLLHKLCSIAASNVRNVLFSSFNGFNSSKPVENFTIISDYGVYPCVHPLIKKMCCVCTLYMANFKKNNRYVFFISDMFVCRRDIKKKIRIFSILFTNKI